MNLLWLGLATAMASDPAALEAAVDVEITRAIAELSLPEKPGPYHVAVDILDGAYCMTEAELGVEVYHDKRPHRTARVMSGSEKLPSTAPISAVPSAHRTA